MIRTETLDNGVRLIIAERPGATATKFQVGIGAGSLQDPKGKLGLAHMLEHLAFEGSPTRSAAQQEMLRGSLGGNWNAWTTTSQVGYYGIVPAKDAKLGASLITDMFTNPATTGKRVKQELAAVKNEMISYDGTLGGQAYDIAQRLVYGDTAATNNVIGTRTSVDAITSKDLQQFHRSYYTGRNTVAVIDGDPKSLALDTIRAELGKLPAGARVDNSPVSATPIRGKALQVVNQSNSGTVNLNVMLPIDDAELAASGSGDAVKLLTSALGSQLNDKLRRNDHLTYGVSAKIESGEDALSGQSVLNVSTNVDAAFAQQALQDIVAVLHDSRDGFGPKTFEKDKAELRARIRTREPDEAATTSQLADVAFQVALANPGIAVPRPSDLAAPSLQQRDKALAKVTLADMRKVASTMTRLDDMKVLAIGDLRDGGESLLQALEHNGIARDSVTRNPVDLKIYRDMGVAVPRNVTPPLRPQAALDGAALVSAASATTPPS